jgi:serine-type D-Ala-D-Ala carboxypeptidase (penicillin-binding protein 5/6)
VRASVHLDSPARPRRPLHRTVGAALLVHLFAALALTAGGRALALETPPPTPVDGKPSPFVTRLRTPAPSTTPPAVRSPVAAVADLDTGQVLYSRGLDRPRPIASVTKLMTAFLVLERTAPHDTVTISRNAAPSVSGYHGSELDLRPGERLSVKDLLYGLLVQSSNDAAIALAEHVSGSVDAFVKLMNRRAKRLGMTDTRYFSPNGLDDRGRSTARDLITITQADYRFAEFARIVSTRYYEIPSPKGKPRMIQNRNVLLWLYPGAIGVKTGYTAVAKFCVVGAAERDGLRLVTVVLGNPDEPFSDAAALLSYGFTAFERRSFVSAGDDLGPIDIPGGRVWGSAGEDLRALVPKAAASEATRRIEVDPRAGFPPAPGEEIATLRVGIPGLELGRIPVLASKVPPPPPPEPGPWWRRTASAVLDAVGDVVHSALG